MPANAVISRREENFEIEGFVASPPECLSGAGASGKTSWTAIEWASGIAYWATDLELPSAIPMNVIELLPGST
jgi:hypothetical protein